MIFSKKQELTLNNIIQSLTICSDNIEWIIKEEDRKYINTEYENLVICLGHGELDHWGKFEDLQESYYYYNNKHQLDYFIQVFKVSNNNFKYVVHKCNNGELNGSTKISSGILEF